MKDGIELRRILLSLSIALFVSLSHAQPLRTDWYDYDAGGHARVHLYFFWSKKCPHCLQSLPFLQKLGEENDWLVVHSLELTGHPRHARLYRDMAHGLGGEARSVPAFIYCGAMRTGFESAATTGEQLRRQLQGCYEYVKKHPGTGVFPADFGGPPEVVELPLIGELDSSRQSLLLLTGLIAGMDAFNPCAFFVLLFLLSMLAHAQSRARMLVIGGVFVFFSGFVYFVFMAAWLNLFLYFGELRMMTLAAGVLAVSMAAVNIKDYFRFHRGVSLSIPESAKPRLFQRMRRLLAMENLFMALAATVLLALAANSYELLCTAGFPMVYTRILTLRELSGTGYYLYLLLYNIVYVLPLLVIVLLFSLRLGSRKLTEREGRNLKLLSGNMMLMLGALLIFAPQWLNNVLIAALLLLSAVVLTVLADKAFKIPTGQPGPRP